MKELYRLSYHGNNTLTVYKPYGQYERGCAVQARHILSTREDMQYESDISSAEVRMCITNQAHHQDTQVDHQVLVQGGRGVTTQNTFQ